jgi:hypothetical protein
MSIYENIRITRDDLIPFLYDNQTIVQKMIELCNKNCPIDVLLWEISDICGLKNLTWDVIKQLIVDAKALGGLAEVTIAGDVLPIAITRPAVPSGIGCNQGGNVWVTPPAEPYVLRFYVNGNYKLSFDNYNTAALAELGAVSGDIVQICEVAAGVVGWWARIQIV